MDPLTHALTGGLSAQVFSNREKMGSALLCGAVAGMLPDLDILIRSESNPLLVLEYHRHFTHSLLFIPLGGLLAALFLWIFLRRQLSFSKIFLFCAIGYAQHGWVDAATSYGTHLLWPFSNERTSWSILPIVDPLVTIPLLLGAIWTTSTRRPVRAWVPLLFLLSYAGFGWFQNRAAETSMRELAQQRGHSIERFDVKPTIFQLLLWRSIYEHDGRFYVDAHRPLPGATTITYQGSSIERFNPKTDSPLPPNSRQHRDLERFQFFSDGFIAQTGDNPVWIADLRYSILPHQLTPLWAIRLFPETPELHVAFENFRRVDSKTWSEFYSMIIGQSHPQDELPNHHK